MTAYYKATRPDGTDFATGTLKHEVGAVVEHPTTKRFGQMVAGDPSTYLSVSVEPADCTGMRWPCRLWRVEPVGRTVKRTDGQYPNKRGCRALRVVEELPAHMALGPNGEAVAALLERASRLTEDEARRLSAAWSAARSAAWSAARSAAWSAARRSAARSAAWSAAPAPSAAQSAALALVVRDLITPEQFDLLYGPWREVIEQ